MKKTLAVVLVAMAVLGGCGDKENDMDVQQRAEERAVQTRTYVDGLIERLGGTDLEVVGDDTIDCDPQDPDAGLVHNYTVRFGVGDDAVERLQGEIADELEADGWTVRRDPRNEERGVDSVRFLKDSFSIGSKISDSGNATAGGSSGCVQ